MLWICVGVTVKVTNVNNVESPTLMSTSKNTHRGTYQFRLIYPEDGDSYVRRNEVAADSHHETAEK